jgi:hypothetical protein
MNVSTMAKPDGANAQSLEFVYYPEPEHEWITLGNGERRIRCCVRRHRIVKKNARWVHVEHDPYGQAAPIGQKRRTFILSRHDLDTYGGAYRRDKLPDHESYYATERRAIASYGADPADSYAATVQAAIDSITQAAELFAKLMPERDRIAGKSRRVACFTTLGIKPTASVAEIKAAYRRLALERHPDVGGDHNGFVRLRQAYEQALRVAT